VPIWAWIIVAIVAIYALVVATLVVAGRQGDASAFVRFVPDCVVLFRRLLRDPRVARRHRILLFALVGYLLLPFDIVPDFVPVAGQLDDAIIVVWALRIVLRGAGREALVEHWPGPERSLELLLKAL
jgi:uncharacterized membrane protein YkvA (DUF1232 family)